MTKCHGRIGPDLPMCQGARGIPADFGTARPLHGRAGMRVLRIRRGHGPSLPALLLGAVAGAGIPLAGVLLLGHPSTGDLDAGAPLATPDRPPPTGPPRLPAADPDRVTRRNPFCSACGPTGPAPPGAPPCALPAPELLVTLLLPGDPGASRALVRFGTPPRTRLIGPGSTLGPARVTAVTAQGVLLRGCGREQRLGWGAAPTPVQTAVWSAPGSQLPVRPLGPHRFAVDRQWVLSTLGHLGPALAQGAARPVLRGRRMVGVRLLRLPPGAAFQRLGLRAGDQITAINGRALDSPDALLWVMSTLPSARHVTVAVERQRRAVTLAYRIE